MPRAVGQRRMQYRLDLGPAAGVIASKVLALGLGGLCVYTNKPHVIRWISYWFGALVIWNLIVIPSTSWSWARIPPSMPLPPEMYVTVGKPAPPG